MNFYDGELIRAGFLRRGYIETDSADEADVCMFHTCSVREHAEERVHSLVGELRRVKKAKPQMVLAVVGCMADREGQELFAREPHVDIVCGSRHFPSLPSFVDRVVGGEQRICELGKAPGPVDAAKRDLSGRSEGFSAHVAVMRGCDLNCTYCIVPSVRGRVESRPVSEICSEVRALVAAGVTEIQLLGQTVDAYGRDRKDGATLASLVDKLSAMDDLQRLRLVTLHPSYVDKELVAALARSRPFMRFLPIPMQSGSDRILKAMKRGYSVEGYRKKVKMLRGAMPDLELISDWIVGFPTETDEDFAMTEAAMTEFGFLQSYVFQYSPRPGTTAFELADDIPREFKKKRNHRLLELQRSISRERTLVQVGNEGLLMLESTPDDAPGMWAGRMQNGHRALLPHRDGFAPGQTYSVDLVSCGKKALQAADGLTPEEEEALVTRARQEAAAAAKAAIQAAANSLEVADSMPLPMIAQDRPSDLKPGDPPERGPHSSIEV
ncbi:MAG: MiaB/RimO family radical SAM methylthiotransferase [Planctomycetes bacterium]|nr:MiaB/RimO family radical SAM methylthiotransferase [Planctomycetota bacterium]MBT4029725.1 MiaB/RimO family radical SAM methylthiotransferase [Planctomycetota bacterium]MBT4561225.1 MiaB/RimO family radical SAM methylthiotransferase [Planctomycetota bacterium]MBT5100511.1 MiaB/RimO family radical SAM methylthiotransferase [Planctomycetota bacterium]MBT7012372.1 MiaB/RimO family radical SAM methylthiotransferase [Planctomycetota bacterium]